jgi:hypothetical protein
MFKLRLKLFWYRYIHEERGLPTLRQLRDLQAWKL